MDVCLGLKPGRWPVLKNVSLNVGSAFGKRRGIIVDQTNREPESAEASRSTSSFYLPHSIGECCARSVRAVRIVVRL